MGRIFNQRRWKRREIPRLPTEFSFPKCIHRNVMVWTYLDVYYGSAEEVAVEYVRVGNLALSLGNIQCCCIPIHRTFSLSSSLPFAPPFLVLYALMNCHPSLILVTSSGSFLNRNVRLSLQSFFIFLYFPQSATSLASNIIDHGLTSYFSPLPANFDVAFDIRVVKE